VTLVYAVIVKLNGDNKNIDDYRLHSDANVSLSSSIKSTKISFARDLMNRLHFIYLYTQVLRDLE